MKISYKVLKNYIKDLASPEEIAKDLVMHTAEVEDIVYEGENLKDVFIGEIKTCKKHPESDKLNCTTVEVNGKTLAIVCGAPNVRPGLKVPVAIVGAKLKEDFVISKVKIRGEDSEGMICSEDELGLVKDRQDIIMELPEDAPLNMNFGEYLNKNGAILEIDNKAINHRPDLFSHIGIAREIEAIRGKKLDYKYIKKDLSNLPSIGIKIQVPTCSRYMGVKIENIKNIESPEYVKDVLNSAGVTPKGLLIDLTNYSLYLYGQPMHAYDADKVEGSIRVRYALDGEKVLALNDTEYTLSSKDMVIADDKKALGIAGVIGGKYSAVSSSTKSIILEAANFDQASVRATGKRLGVRTDALNIYEKDIVDDLQTYSAGLYIDELQKIIPDIKLTGMSDEYPKKQETVKVPFDLDFMNRLNGYEVSKDEAIKVLSNLSIELDGDYLIIPFWRKDLNFKADIAEELARITGYDKIPSTLPQIETAAVIQDNTYKIKNDIKNYFTSIGYFDLFTYSFVNEALMKRCLGTVEDLIPVKNALSEELTHMRGSVIPNLLSALEQNFRDYKELRLFEIEKVFRRVKNDAEEHYSLGGVQMINDEIGYYDIQNTVTSFLYSVGIYQVSYDVPNVLPSYAHPSRTARIIIRGQDVGFVGEINPKVANNFEIENRVTFFEIDTDKILNCLYQTFKAKDVSTFQENDFDLSFVVDKSTKAFKIHEAIAKTDQSIIQKVDLIDIYEDDEKLAGKRSLSYRVYIQSMEKTLDDKDKAKLIKDITDRVTKAGGTLRS